MEKEREILLLVPAFPGQIQLYALLYGEPSGLLSASASNCRSHFIKQFYNLYFFLIWKPHKLIILLDLVTFLIKLPRSL